MESLPDIGLKQLIRMVPEKDVIGMDNDFFIIHVRFNDNLMILRYPCRCNAYIIMFCNSGEIDVEINLNTYTVKSHTMLVSAPGNIIKVDGFLNHRIDTELMEHIAEEFGKHFNMDEVSLILTAEASGIALSAIVAQRFHKPMIFAKKAKSDNIEGGLYQSDIFSYTYKKKVTLLVSKEWMSADDKVLIIDDFMANGEAMRGLCDIVDAAGATLVGIGCAVEKGFQGGGDRLRAAGVNLKSLAIIESAEPGNIVFREED